MHSGLPHRYSIHVTHCHPSLQTFLPTKAVTCSHCPFFLLVFLWHCHAIHPSDLWIIFSRMISHESCVMGYASKHQLSFDRSKMPWNLWAALPAFNPRYSLSSFTPNIFANKSCHMQSLSFFCACFSSTLSRRPSFRSLNHLQQNDKPCVFCSKIRP